MECWICGSRMRYAKDEDMEGLGSFKFDCDNCGEAVLCPQNAPYLEEEDFI